MKVVLLQDIAGTGKKDDIINVSDGYARNYLLPRKLAQEANNQNLNDIRNRERAAQHRIDEEKKTAERIAQELQGATVRVAAKAGEHGKLFGSVTAKEIAESLSRHTGIPIDKRKITIEHDIKSFGTYQCEIKLYSGISAKLYVLVGDHE
ncbi:MAG: 50S ribosomal protein L9 [Oscillospiraceae bacterium]|nr:50S ribosomal protein L9 [Oscillospiraceae bacterium]